MVIRTSFRGMVIWFVSAGVLALAGLALASSETDERCEEFGYFVKDSFTCEASSGLTIAYFFGGNCLLAGLSLGWSLFKRKREDGRFFDSDVIGIKSRSWSPPKGHVFYGFDSVKAPIGNWSLGQPRRTFKEREQGASENESQSPREDIATGIDEGSSRQAMAGQPHVEPPTIDSGPQGSATVSNEGNSLTNEFRLASFPKVIDEKDIENCLNVSPSGFEASQASLTASHLVSRLVNSERQFDIDGLKLIGFFRAGLQIAHAGYGLPLALPSVLDAPPDERLTFLEAITDDSQYFMDIDDAQIEAAFLLLPVPVRYWFHRKVEEESKGLPLSVLHTCFLRMFVCGIAYVAFQASSAG